MIGVSWAEEKEEDIGNYNEQKWMKSWHLEEDWEITQERRKAASAVENPVYIKIVPPAMKNFTRILSFKGFRTNLVLYLSVGHFVCHLCSRIRVIHITQNLFK